MACQSRTDVQRALTPLSQAPSSSGLSGWRESPRTFPCTSANVSAQHVDSQVRARCRADTGRGQVAGRRIDRAAR
eukprot:scaffold11197_cov33-Tisochrysis_lutea.AAC.4